MASGIEFLHGQNIMHRDIKPSNTLLDDGDKAILIDFGAALEFDDDGTCKYAMTSTITKIYWNDLGYNDLK